MSTPSHGNPGQRIIIAKRRQTMTHKSDQLTDPSWWQRTNLENHSYLWAREGLVTPGILY